MQAREPTPVTVQHLLPRPSSRSFAAPEEISSELAVSYSSLHSYPPPILASDSDLVVTTPPSPQILPTDVYLTLRAPLTHHPWETTSELAPLDPPHEQTPELLAQDTVEPIEPVPNPDRPWFIVPAETELMERHTQMSEHPSRVECVEFWGLLWGLGGGWVGRRGVGSYAMLGSMTLQCIVGILALSLNTGSCDQPIKIYISIHTSLQVLFLFLATYSRSRHSSISIDVASRATALIPLLTTPPLILGLTLHITSKTCYLTSPFVYFTSLAFMIITFILVVVAPLALCMCDMSMTQNPLGINSPAPPRLGGGAGDDIVKRIPVRLVVKRDGLMGSTDGGLVVSNPMFDTQPEVREKVMQPPPAYFRSLKQKAKFIMPPKFRIMPMSAGLVELPLDDVSTACVICLGVYENGERVNVLSCSHHFHVKCLQDWLKKNRTCPLCVRDVVKMDSGCDLA